MKAVSDPINKTATKLSGPQPAMAFRHFAALATALVLAATGLVGSEDIAFCILSTIYAFFLTKFIFPSTSTGPEPRIFAANNKALGLYIWVSAFVGLFFPVLYMLVDYAEDDRTGIRAAGPHLFLLTMQVFMEGFTFSRGFSRPAWAFVPVCYNSRRLISISDWLRVEFAPAAGRGSRWLVYAGRSLAVANMGFWTFNLFGFLLPVFLPMVFKRYYGRKIKLVLHFGSRWWKKLKYAKLRTMQSIAGQVRSNTKDNFSPKKTVSPSINRGCLAIECRQGTRQKIMDIEERSDDL